MTPDSTITVETVSPEIRKVVFANPPCNLVGPETATRLLEVVDELSADEQVKVAIFTSATDGYFYNHADLAQLGGLLALVADDGTPGWVELVSRLTNAPFVSIAEIRGRTRGGGNELTVAFDLRYASLEQTSFMQLEVATGLIPGGGGTDRLSRFGFQAGVQQIGALIEQVGADEVELDLGKYIAMGAGQ